jgi:hypothetical protein
MLKALLGASLMLAPAPAVPQTNPTGPAPKVICRQEHGYSAGTAFRIGPHLLVSVNHVTSAGNCEIDGEPIHILYASRKADFSILSDDRLGKWLKVDCGGFVKGRMYVAVGHARAMDDLTFVPMVATGMTSGSLSILAGVFTAQPGQSGGPILDGETGKVVGTVNTAQWDRGLTGSIELRGTSICGGGAA